MDDGHHDVSSDEKEKNESEHAMRVAKSTMKLPRHAGSRDGKHQRIQRQMPAPSLTHHLPDAGGNV